MAGKTTYRFEVDPQQVDFTLRMTIPALGSEVLNVAGIDAQRKGFGIDVLNRNNFSWVLSRMALEIDDRPEQYTAYRITTWVNEYTRLMSTRNFTLHDARGREFGRAVTQWCVIDLTARKAIDLSALARDHADTLCDAPSPTEKPRKILGIEPQQVSEHRVVYSDIDFNRHVNTMRYINMMFDRLPIELLAEVRPVRLDVQFMQECRYGQLLSIGYEQRGGSSLFEISNADAIAVRAAFEWR
ncbi:MAG TPA: acyl-ACP thioesterase [Candidatus Alistipes avicola]|uniref:Acyl-ACP thioesterase n=1 Tax=Candidatus Alistipes avicola TaxID=2838432 RepID=A0A9D2L303_9BACT|nr:acyl-ACP thioesterase domain-containing protein [uncultured Alistipes sp.]HJA98257.1 acyl-ACP thioesterase [Candidatus Alistipes avicola]